jgi:CheY-like chemotaxis protein
VNRLKILFVDDDPLQHDLFRDAVDDWNEKNAPKVFVPILIDNVTDAVLALEDRRFDCALFDLKLPAAEGPGKLLTGNELARTGLDELGVPVGIISGFPGDLSVELAGRKLVRTFVKAAGASAEAMNWFGELWDMMEVLSATRRRIRRSGAEIFARRIWPRWGTYRDLAIVGEDGLERIITRQYAGHIAELFGTDTPENPEWHPIEAYIHPALQDNRAHTGDIFQKDGQFWIVLSPPCDMAVGSIDDVLLAYCDKNLLENWNAKVEALRIAIAAGEVSKGLKGFFSSLINQNVEASKHFLPPLEGAPLMVNFKKLTTRPLAELNATLEDRVASVSAPFLINLTQRFGAYISRTGQPNIDIHHFAKTPAVAQVLAANA